MEDFWQKLNEIDQRWLLGAILVIIIIFVVFILLTLKGQHKPPVPTPTPTAVQSSSSYLPIQLKQAGEPANVWLVKKIKNNALRRNGFYYDVVTFVNKSDPSLRIKAQCAEPGWPSPDIGAEYTRNKWGVLAPVHDNKKHNLQRFIDLDYIKS